MRNVFALLALSVSGCVEEPTQQQAMAAAQEQASATPQKQLEQDAKNIEQAAEQAVKLIEAEAKAEAEAEADRVSNETD